MLLLLATACTAPNRGFEWGYRVCDIKSSDCGEYVALFKTRDDCVRHLERASHRCLGAEHLRGLALEAPVCWKTESIIGRSECNKY
jgi:hypothetical protein